MLAQKKVKENFLATQKVGTPAEDNMILTEAESVHFKNEINKQLSETKIIDIGKAMRNARYLAKIDRAFADKNAGLGKKFTFEELERFANEIRGV